jgi:hypothetical protein
VTALDYVKKREREGGRKEGKGKEREFQTKRLRSELVMRTC